MNSIFKQCTLILRSNLLENQYKPENNGNDDLCRYIELFNLYLYATIDHCNQKNIPREVRLLYDYRWNNEEIIELGFVTKSCFCRFRRCVIVFFVAFRKLIWLSKNNFFIETTR